MSVSNTVKRPAARRLRSPFSPLAVSGAKGRVGLGAGAVPRETSSQLSLKRVMTAVHLGVRSFSGSCAEMCSLPNLSSRGCISACFCSGSAPFMDA